MKTYGLIGKTLKHSFSKKYFTEKFEKEGIEGCQYVAEFQESSLLEMKEKVNDFSFEYIQVKSSEIAKELMNEGYKVILVQDSFKQENVDYILSHSDDIPEDTNTPILYGGDVNLKNLDNLLQKNITGIHLLGSDEIRPGFKDFDELADILEHLESD